MFDRITKLMPSKRQTEEGASAVEYGLLVALIAAVVVVAVVALGGLVRDTFQDTCESIGTESATATGEPSNCQ